MMPYLYRILQKYTTFDESDTHPLIFFMSLSYIAYNCFDATSLQSAENIFYLEIILKKKGLNSTTEMDTVGDHQIMEVMDGNHTSKQITQVSILHKKIMMGDA